MKCSLDSTNFLEEISSLSHSVVFFYLFALISEEGFLVFFFFSFIFISLRLITLQYCSGFCHTLTWISHGFTCVPHPDPPSHLPLDLIPLALPSAHQVQALVSCIQPGLVRLSYLSSLFFGTLHSNGYIFLFLICLLLLFFLNFCKASLDNHFAFLHLTVWWCPCVELSLVLLKEGVCSDQCIVLAKLLAFALLHFVLQG